MVGQQGVKEIREFVIEQINIVVMQITSVRERVLITQLRPKTKRNVSTHIVYIHVQSILGN